MKKIIYLSIFFIFQKTFSIDPILITSIPKCGTWMLNKCITLLTKKRAAIFRLHKEGILRFHVDENVIQLFTPSLQILEKCTTLYGYEYLIAHLIYKKEYENLLKTKKFKVLFIIRDPRDQIISRIFFIYKNPKAYSGLQHLSIDQLITGLIGTKKIEDFNDLYFSHLKYINKPNNTFISNINSFYKHYLGWLNSKTCHVIKFENLVGEIGGGSNKQQFDEIKNIAKHINLKVSDQDIKKTSDNLYGNTGTFREGKIGAWKKYFKEEHKKAFKEVAGQLLIDLDYEKDFNW